MQHLFFWRITAHLDYFGLFKFVFHDEKKPSDHFYKNRAFKDIPLTEIAFALRINKHL